MIISYLILHACKPLILCRTIDCFSWGSSFLCVCNRLFYMFFLSFVVVCWGTKAGEACRINILVKKAGSVVGLSMDSLEALAQGWWRLNWTPSWKMPSIIPSKVNKCSYGTCSACASFFVRCNTEHLEALQPSWYVTPNPSVPSHSKQAEPVFIASYFCTMCISWHFTTFGLFFIVHIPKSVCFL